MSGVLNIVAGNGTGLPTLHTYTSGSGTETVPSGATTLIIEAIGTGGNGGIAGAGFGGGGGAGAYCRSSYAATPGQTLNYTIISGTITITSGTATITTMIAAPGTDGGNYPPGTDGTGGTATGGNVVNSNGAGGAGGSGGVATTSIYVLGIWGTGGNGYDTGAVTPGFSGILNFYYT